MTQEEKAERYDKISKEVKDFFEGKQKMYSDVEQTLNHLFPELKESKDEQIRKVLVEWFKRYKEQDTCGSEMFNGIPTDNILAWLEKQGSEPNWYHHKVDLSDCSEEYRKAYYDGWNNCNMQHSQYKSESNDVVKCLINGMKFYYEDNEEATWGTEKFSMKVKDILSWLEKQGEQKETLCEKCKKAQPSHSCQDITALGRCAVEHEQKTADDVEPKFHKGEWITNGDYTWKIVEVKPLDYILQSQDGNIVDDTISHVDEHFHSFTIEDAKDGDVLCCENGWTCIFKTLVKDETFSSYCFMDNTKWFCETGSECHTLNKEFMKAYNGEIKPATKEQRDALERAITNAGHRFDFEKKELKKVEQEQDSINPSEYINDIGGNGCYLKNTTQVSAWSEEDEKMVNDIIAAIDTLYYHGMVNWLKSLKRRCTWKPSEEQIIALNNAVLLNEDHYNGAVLSTLLEQLKKL